jgi:hypothetical protein
MRVVAILSLLVTLVGTTAFAYEPKVAHVWFRHSPYTGNALVGQTGVRAFMEAHRIGDALFAQMTDLQVHEFLLRADGCEPDFRHTEGLLCDLSVHQT